MRSAGKLIGVYLGRPFEGWTYERIMQELGPIDITSTYAAT